MSNTHGHLCTIRLRFASLGLSFLICKLRDEIPSNFKVPEVYSVVDNCTHQLEPGYGAFQTSPDTGRGASGRAVTSALGETSQGGASADKHLAPATLTWLLPLPPQQGKLSPHVFSFPHCAGKIPGQQVVSPVQPKTCRSSPLLVSRQDCMQTVPERKPPAIFLKISK